MTFSAPLFPLPALVLAFLVPLKSFPAAPVCTAVVAQHADDGADHAVNCTPLSYNTNPPSSGLHFGTWAAYKTYDKPVPSGFLVHDLEHGAVVIGYNCPDGCADEVALVQAWISAKGNDAQCGGYPFKLVLAPNPDLDVRWAAAAWAWTWKAPCADTASLEAFFKSHYNQTVESPVCGGGADMSPVGWCPSTAAAPRSTAQWGNLQGTQGRMELWSGSLPKRTRLRVEARAAVGSLLASEDLGEAGPGAARAVWDGIGFGKLHPGTGPVLLQVRTARGDLLAGRLAQP